MFVVLDRLLPLWRKWTFRSEHFNPPASRFVISKGSCSPSAFARLMSKLAEAGADRLYRFIDRWWPVARRQFRSIRRFSIAIQLVVHARWKRRAVKNKLRARSIYGKRVPTRTKVHGGPCARDAFAHGSFVVDSLAFTIAFFFFRFFVFRKRKETNFSCLRAFADICRLINHN